MRTTFEVPKRKHFANLAMLVAAFAGVAAVTLAPRTAAHGVEIEYLLVLLAFLGYGVVHFARMPYRITIAPDDVLVFTAVLRESRLPAGEVEEIRSESFGYFVRFRTARQSLVVPGSTRGLPELIAWLHQREGTQLKGERGRFMP